MPFWEKFRVSVSVGLGVVLFLLVGLLWHQYNQELDRAQKDKVSDTNRLVAQQFGEVLYTNVGELINLKHRLEITDGSYFNYWNQDAARIVDHEPSFDFVEWINSDMVISNIEPYKGNEEAIGLDISKLSYRRSDWLQARQDSTVNITHWIELVQDNHAILVDAPVYYSGEFKGTITAGMDFTLRFDTIMQGFDEYYVQVRDEQGQVFYTHGTKSGTGQYSYLTSVDSIYVSDVNPNYWTIRMTPNELFAQENSQFSNYLILLSGLAMSVLIALLFFAMQKSFAAERAKDTLNKQLRALIESAPLGIYVLDTEGRIRDFWNDAAEQMLGWSKEEVWGEKHPFLKSSNSKEFEELLTYAIQNDGIQDQIVRRKRKDGSEKIFRVNIGPMIEREKRMLVLIEDITREQRYEQQLKESLEEKKVMLAEIHHRVKNNLAIIIGLIDLQKEVAEDSDTKSLLNETMNRIYSISGVHELLYKSDSFSMVDFDQYVYKLLMRIEQTNTTEQTRFHWNANIECSNLSMNQAIPLGLILNELFTYSFEQAREQQRDLNITLDISQKEEQVHIYYGIDQIDIEWNSAMPADTLGFTLIEALLHQLSANYKLSKDNGFAINITFDAEVPTRNVVTV